MLFIGLRTYFVRVQDVILVDKVIDKNKIYFTFFSNMKTSSDSENFLGTVLDDSPSILPRNHFYRHASECSRSRVST